jgi:4-hydroxythreonine-4-phosphate dehydrogenase
MTAEKEDPKPKIAITMGDSRGIGPEVVAKAFARASLLDLCRPMVLGDVNVLSRTVASMGLGLRVIEVGERPPEFRPGVLPVLPLSHLPPDKGPGEISPQESSRASFAYVEMAGRMALEGRVEAIVTAPVSKEAIHGAGIPFRGHTEYLAEISGRGEYAMMVAGERLKVAFVTTHIPLRSVARLLQEKKILSVIEITGRGLRDYFNLSGPRIAVAALNPHAGEGGLFGEEEGIISRAVQRARDQGLFVSGPWPADTLFPRAQQGEFDAVVCMYHDQGLIPLKLLHFDTAVNVTLGLPLIRTSVDHGVAYDIAGKGLANPSSMVEAIRLAIAMAIRKRDFHKS